jgi:Spy/CpxP family protein refolding chaperone
MNRRQMIMLPGVALVAQQVSAQAAQAPGAGSRPASQHVSHKVLLKYDRPKAISKVPKSAAKTAKYLSSLTTLLGLSSAQQEQATAIFAAAVAARTPIRANMKTTRQALTTAIKNNNSTGIAQLSVALGNLTGQHTAAGANANAAFYQILTADQQSMLTQIKS